MCLVVAFSSVATSPEPSEVTVPAKAVAEVPKTAKTNSKKPIVTRKDKIAYSENLANLPKAIDDRFGAARYAVMLGDMSAKNVLEINVDEQFTAASTYKLFTAYLMLSAVETGAWSWQNPIAGTTLSECFDRMIVKSDNACPLAYLERVSYSGANATLRNMGFGSTVLAYDMLTTARDLTTFLGMIYDQKILSPESNERLLKAMRQQIFRNGIPAGIGDAGVVADKVGFLDSYLNDAGIVYRSKGDYILVILTQNSSWAAIADVTALINAKI
jgi:beta-lactamase class A